jgi:hypothetical protein
MTSEKVGEPKCIKINKIGNPILLTKDSIGENIFYLR